MHDFYAKYAEFCSSFLPTEFDLDRRTLQVAVELARPDWSAVNQSDDRGHTMLLMSKSVNKAHLHDLSAVVKRGCVKWALTKRLVLRARRSVIR